MLFVKNLPRQTNSQEPTEKRTFWFTIYVTIHRITSSATPSLVTPAYSLQGQQYSTGNLPEQTDGQDPTELVVVSADCRCRCCRYGQGTVISSPCFLYIQTRKKHQRTETVKQWSRREPKSDRRSLHFCQKK